MTPTRLTRRPHTLDFSRDKTAITGDPFHDLTPPNFDCLRPRFELTSTSGS